MLYDAYACHNVWGCDVLAGEDKSRSCWRIVLNSSFPLGMVNEDGCENKPVGKKITPLGNKLDEEITLRGILCGKRRFAEILTITPLGIPLISSIGDFDDELRWG